MVCFCDIPLAQVNKHISIYGHYAIGLNKDWGIRNRISPVHYVYKNSATSQYLKTAIKIIRMRNNKLLRNEISEDKGLFGNLMDAAKFLKPYNGLLKRDEKSRARRVRFYDEREWRFMPRIKKSDGPPKAITEGCFSDNEFKAEVNKKLETYRLLFEPSDIKYIIVANIDEVHEMTKKVEEIYKEKEKITHLIREIISIQEIREDF